MLANEFQAPVSYYLQEIELIIKLFSKKPIQFCLFVWFVKFVKLICLADVQIPSEDSPF